MQALTITSMLAGNMDAIYARLVQYLSQRCQLPLNYATPTDWQTRERLFVTGEASGGFMCGLIYTRKTTTLEPLVAPIMAAARYQHRPVYFSDVIVRADSAFGDFAALRGQRWALNERASFSGHAVVCDHLNTLGETHAYFGDAVVVGSHGNAITAVVAGEAAAAAIDSTVLERAIALNPALTTHIRSIAALGPSPIPPMVVQKNMPLPLKQQLREVLMTMHQDPDGAALLNEAGIAQFVAVSDADYDDIRKKAAATQWVTLSPAERERSFALPQHSMRDLAALEHMRKALLEVLPTVPGPGKYIYPDPSSEHHRQIVVDLAPLKSGQALAVVGFFGQRNWNCPAEILREIDDADAALVRDLVRFPYAVSYSSLKLADGNWGNLVVLNATDGIEAWREGEVHKQVVDGPSPHFYSTIRLHRGVMPGGLGSPVQLRSVKLFDYRGKMTE